MTKSQKAVQAAEAEVKRLWSRMCLADNIPSSAPFIVFSETNPIKAEYNLAVVKMFAARKRERANAARRAKHAAYTSCGMTRVKGALGGVYYE